VNVKPYASDHYEALLYFGGDDSVAEANRWWWKDEIPESACATFSSYRRVDEVTVDGSDDPDMLPPFACFGANYGVRSDLHGLRWSDNEAAVEALVEAGVIDEDDEHAVRSALEALAGLDQYPLLDDDAHSEIERERETEALYARLDDIIRGHWDWGTCPTPIAEALADASPEVEQAVRDAVTLALFHSRYAYGVGPGYSVCFEDDSNYLSVEGLGPWRIIRAAVAEALGVDWTETDTDVIEAARRRWVDNDAVRRKQAALHDYLDAVAPYEGTTVRAVESWFGWGEVYDRTDEQDPSVLHYALGRAYAWYDAARRRYHYGVIREADRACAKAAFVLDGTPYGTNTPDPE
jgi:hypothetical protein